MAGDLRIERRGRAGRITLTRPQALNALSAAMVAQIDAALVAWAGDDAVAHVVIDAEGPRAFCAGGDVAELYQMGRMGDFDGPRRYWRDEYVMNRRIATYPKPVVAFMQGFVMGGGVGLGCHARHRIIGASTRMAMPECGIGLVPDVGGTDLLARAPGALGEYLGLAGARMEPGDALLAGFADRFLPEEDWPTVIAALEGGLDPENIPQGAPPPAVLAPHLPVIAAIFCQPDMEGILAALQGAAAASGADAAFAARALAEIGRGSPLSLVCTLALVRAARAQPGVAPALRREFRFTARAPEQADFLEGVRAQLIDKDRTPRWPHVGVASVPPALIGQMMAPLGAAWELWPEEGA